MMAFIPMLVLFLLSYQALINLGQNQKVCEEASKYVLVMAPSIFLIGLADLQRKFLI